MSSWLRSAGRALAAAAIAAAVLLSVPSARAGDGWRPSDDDALLFDLRVKKWRLGDGVRGYQLPDGICVDLADMVLALDLPIRVDTASRRANGWIFDEARAFTLDRDLGTVEVGGRSSPIAPGSIRDTPEGWCVEVSALAGWMGVGLRADQGNALLFVESERKLPFELAEERKERAAKVRPQRSFNLAHLPRAETPYRAWRTPSVDASFSMTARHGGSAGSAARALDARFELYASGEALGASVDARLASDEKAMPRSIRVRAYRSDPAGGLLGPLAATHAAIGDVGLQPTALAAQNVPGRGIFVTNRPLDRADGFDRTSFSGELPAGWDAELYRNGQLIAFAADRGDGRYEFEDVPLLYGGNGFEIVAYGPQGQVRRERRSFNVGLDSIPARQSWYWAGIAEANRDLVTIGQVREAPNDGWRGGFGIEHGIDLRTSIGGAFTSLVAFGERHHFGELLVRRALGGALLQAGAVVNERGRAAAEARMLAQIAGLNVSAEAFHAPQRFVSDRFDGSVRTQFGLGVDAILDIGTGHYPLRVEAARLERVNGDSVTDLAARLGFNIGQVQMTADYGWRRSGRADGGATDRHLLGLRASGRIGAVRLRGDARYRLGPDPGLENGTMTAEWKAGRRSDWRAEVSHEGRSGTSRVRVGLVRRFARFVLGAQMEAGSDGSHGAGLDLAFSLGPDPAGRGIRFAADRLASNGQLLATVFRDGNGDGIRQQGEPLLSDVGLTAGLSGRGPPTDVSGRSIIDGLAPYKPVLIGVDASTLDDPSLAPALIGRVVTPRPGIVSRIELPVAAAGEIEGVLVREGGAAVQGVDIELLGPDGAVLKSVRSDFDGYFLFESVPAGRYTLRLAALSAGAIRAEQALPVMAELKDGAMLARLGTVIVQPQQRIAAAP